MVIKINSSNVAKSSSPLSQAIKYGNLLFISGQLGRDKQGEIVKPFKAEVKQTMRNLSIILNEAGLTFENVIKANVYLKEMSKTKEFNNIYKQYFSKSYPTRCCIGVNQLAQDANVEIELIAAFEEQDYEEV